MDDVRAFVEAFHAFAGHLAAVGWGALALGILFHFFRLTARVRAWQNILSAAYPDSRIPFWSVFGSYWAGVGVNAITPARSGDLVKLYIAKRRIQGTSYPTLGSSLVVETLFDFVLASTLLLVALQQGLLPGIPDLPGLPAFDWSFAVQHPRLAAILLSVLVAAAILVLTWASRHVVAFKEKVKRGFVILGDWNAFITRVVSWQALGWGFRVVSVFFFLRAFNIPATADTVLAVLVIGGLATTMPFTPGGAGTQQAIFVFALADWASRSAVLSFSVGMQFATIVLNVAIGFGAIAIMLGTVRWRQHVQDDEGLPTRRPAAVRSRSDPRA